MTNKTHTHISKACGGDGGLPSVVYTASKWEIVKAELDDKLDAND